MITQELLKERFEYKDGNLIYKMSIGSKKIGDIAGTVNEKGYVKIGINGKVYGAHCLIWIYHNEYIFKKMDVDHNDKNPSNNKIENLRIATRSQNKANGKKYKCNTSGLKGAYFSKIRKKWQAVIRYNGKNYHIGYYNNKEEAHEAYNKKAIELFGEFACFD